MLLKEFKKELKGKYITLRKLTKSDIPTIKEIAMVEDLWKLIKAPDHNLSDFLLNFCDNMYQEMEKQNQFPYLVIENNTKQIIGSTRFYDISLINKRAAIGFTWYLPEAQGTKVNPEAKLLLLEFAFEKLNLNRIEFHIDSRNERSINAIKKLGAIQEGILRKHKIVQGNFARDTIIASIIKTQWPKVKHN